MAETARIQKRSANTNTDSGKRRSPYALRACGACRRRKGKCDGRQPCRYCLDRGQSCSYSISFETDERSESSVAAISQSKPRPAPPKAANNVPASKNPNPGDSLGELLSSLQVQLDSLASQVHSANRDLEQSDEASPVANASAAKIQELATRLGGTHDVHTAGSPGFYGPTSPDYTLNVGTMKLRHNSFYGLPLREKQLQLASIDEEAASDPSEDEEGEDAENDHPSVSTAGRQEMMTPLLSFRSIMGLQDTMQLIGVYREVVGDLHPVVDVDALTMQTQSWYAESDSGVGGASFPGSVTASCELLMILNLVLVIALRADPSPVHRYKEMVIWESLQNAVNAKLAAPACSINHATIIFLKGWYDFFQEMPRSAWRMCGLAGRTLMELGFHNGEVFNHSLTSDGQRTEACVLISSIVILDRQWSYATGLPLNFHEDSFSSILTSSVQHPYLKAMLSFILISDKFGEPISKTAKGEKYNDDDAFELMNFQIEQWRKKAVGDYTLSECRAWHTDPSTRPPTWAILLNLRAESVRSQLLKPFFFFSEESGDIGATTTATTHLRAATDLVYDICHVLYMLDTHTDIYRKQHPFFQHILACASGLAFLVIAFIKQNKMTTTSTPTTVLSSSTSSSSTSSSSSSGILSLPPDLHESLGGSFLMAERVTTNHAKRSRTARRLSKRLAEMRRVLLGLGILSGPNTGAGEEETLANTSRPVRCEKSAATAATATATAADAQPPEMVGGEGLDLQYPFGGGHQQYATSLLDGSSSAAGTAFVGLFPDTDMEMEWVDSLRLQWPIGDVNHMFSESLL